MGRQHSEVRHRCKVQAQVQVWSWARALALGLTRSRGPAGAAVPCIAQPRWLLRSAAGCLHCTASRRRRAAPSSTALQAARQVEACPLVCHPYAPLVVQIPLVAFAQARERTCEQGPREAGRCSPPPSLAPCRLGKGLVGSVECSWRQLPLLPHSSASLLRLPSASRIS